MNYLAHLFLAAGHKELTIGNFIADQVKGSRYKEYPYAIAQGIVMHRSTDYFSDTHPLYLKSVHRLTAEHGKFSGIITDMLYDHLLASCWGSFSDTDLGEYCSETYGLLLSGKAVIPENARRILTYMVQYDWLGSYSTVQGIEQALKGLSRRMKYYHPLEKAVKNFEADYDGFRHDFEAFFPLLQKHVQQFLP